MFWLSVMSLGLAQIAASGALTRRWDNIVEKHSWVEIPRGWQHKNPAPSNLVFDLKLGLKQHGMDDLISNLMEISDPAHPRYAQHLTKEEVEAFTTPHPDSTAAVEGWLIHHGIDPEQTQRSKSGNWITVPVSVAQAEKMLNTKYNVYQHGPTGEEVIRTLAYSLPQELHAHIDVVAPTTYFGTVRTMKKTSLLQPNLQLPSSGEEAANATMWPVPDATVLANCNSTITLPCLRNLYKTADYVPSALEVNRLGVTGYLNEFANHADLETFLTKYRPDAVGSNFTTVLVNGGDNDQTIPGSEANLDIQYTIGISHPTPNIFYSTGGSPPFIPDSATPKNTNEPYVDFFDFLLAQSDIPQVITTSYGDDEQTVPFDYATRVCNMFAQLGVLGTTIFYSSADHGVGEGDCLTNDGNKRRQFQPSFPASCPFVTAVGATTGINPEVAVSFSGGGFSNYFRRPSYQQQSVDAFLNALGNTTYAGLYNPEGRAYPDLAAQGQNFQVIVGGQVRPIAGTSASAPTVAAIFSLLNDFRLSRNKNPLGFINPLIYSLRGAGLNDITSGSNPGCGTDGFTAGEGWDPVTGLGTPDFLALQKLV